MTFAFTADIVGNGDFARTGNHDLVSLVVRDVTHGRGKVNRTVGTGFNTGSDSGTGCRTTDVERTHR